MKKRPVGLTVLAVINFLFAAGCLLGLLITVASPSLREQTGISLSYTFLSPLVTASLLTISGIGFLRRAYRAGFLCGLAFCILSLGNIVIFNALRGFGGFLLHIPSMVYPTVLLLMLTLRYQPAFSKDEGTTEHVVEGDALTRAP